MEIAKSKNLIIKDLIITVSKAMFKNALMIGIGLGFVANLIELKLPNDFL